jgi:hypothetical protein
MGNAKCYIIRTAMIKTAHVVPAEAKQGGYDALGMQLWCIHSITKRIILNWICVL